MDSRLDYAVYGFELTRIGVERPMKSTLLDKLDIVVE